MESLFGSSDAAAQGPPRAFTTFDVDTLTDANIRRYLFPLFYREMTTVTQNQQIRRRFLVGAACALLMAQSILPAQSNVGVRIQIVDGNEARNTIETIPPT